MSDVFDLAAPGFWFGPKGCAYKVPKSQEWSEVAEAAHAFKEGDFSLREGLAARVSEFKDENARQIGIFILMCVSNDAVIKIMEPDAVSSESSAMDFSSFAIYSLSPAANDVLRQLTEKYGQSESGDVIRHFYEETKIIGAVQANEFYWNSKLVYIGDLCLEVQKEIARCRLSDLKFKRADLATVLSIFTGELFPIGYGQAISETDVKLVIDYVKSLAARRDEFVRGCKYFYGSIVT